jgi:plastocyanin
VGRRNIIRSTVLVAIIFVALLVAGAWASSSPSDETLANAKPPTTTTTTEAPPEGVAVVRLSNGVFRPANLDIDLAVVQTVQWVNEDDREYLIRSTDGEFESPLLAQGDTFEFDFSTLPPGIHRYNALVGFQRIPGSVDSRPNQ